MANLTKRLDSSLDEANATLGQILNLQGLPQDLQSKYEYLRDDIADCKASSARLAKAPGDQLLDDAETATADVIAMFGLVGVLDDISSEVPENLRGGFKSLWETLKRLLAGVSHILRKIISCLMRVREWTLQAEVSIGPIPSGRAGITVTFGQ